MSQARRTRHFARGAGRLRIARRRGRMFRAWRKLLRLPRLAHKASVMQALKPCLYEYWGGGGGRGIESVRTNGVSVLSGLNLEKM